MKALRGASWIVVLALVTACWDEPEKILDDRVGQAQDASAGDTDTDTDGDADSDTDTRTDTDTLARRPGAPEGWEGFGAACETDEDCQGYPGERRCIHNILDMIAAPGGYCTACCNEEHESPVSKIECVGAYNAYLIYILHCTSDENCRQADGYECRPIYFVPEVFPGLFCLPDPEHAFPPEGLPPEEPLDCPWPWL